LTVTQGYRSATQNRRRVSVPGLSKGAFILHMLRMMMFNQGSKGRCSLSVMMKDLVKSNFNRDISTEDFRRWSRSICAADGLVL